MNKKGFTLVELLATITILAVISTIAAFSYTRILKDNKVKQCEQKILYIEKQMVKYASDSPDLLHDINTIELPIEETIENLLQNNYLINEEDDSDIINPLTEREFKGGELVITKNNGLIDVKYRGDECNE